ncbi:MAG: hypothetical protein VYA60_08145 [Pseudomonadota bacterium]|nr:hypothetical protein [Pseudomonadota bacterium]
MMKDNKEKKITAESLLGLFRDHFEDETGTKIDFRKHQYLENSYGLTPTFSYSFAETIVDSLYRWANTFIAEHQERFVVSGFEHNTMMSCDKLRSQSLKSLIEDVCDSIASSWK